MSPAILYVRVYYTPSLRGQPLSRPITAASECSPVFVLASFQKNHAFFNQTNRAVGQLTFFRTLVRRFSAAQTLVWECRGARRRGESGAGGGRGRPVQAGGARAGGVGGGPPARCRPGSAA